MSQAGYNTVVEGLAGGARMVLVPFAAGGEDEQTRRALRLAGWASPSTSPRHALSPPALAAAIDRVAARPRPEPGAWSLRRRRTLGRDPGGPGESDP